MYKSAWQVNKHTIVYLQYYIFAIQYAYLFNETYTLFIPFLCIKISPKKVNKVNKLNLSTRSQLPKHQKYCCLTVLKCPVHADFQTVYILIKY